MKLNVFWDTRLVGQIWLDKKQNLIFQYDKDYFDREDAHPLSLRLPLREDPYGEDAARPFFSNLLPEGDIRDLISKVVHVSRNNDFALLREIGGECAGAISILPEGHTPLDSGSYQEISRTDLEDMLEERTKKPLLVSRKELRLSLAGAQDKLPVYISGDKLYLPTENAPSSHILKPQIKGFADTVHNEAFCMMLAKKIFTPSSRIPGVSIWRGERGPENDALIIERYDRKTLDDGRIQRIHQEDFCQALGYLANRKYENEGGPGLQEGFALLSRFSTQPLVDRLHLLKWVIYDFIIGNNDAHAKNLAILFLDGKPILAPFYDLICTQVYPELSEKMAMKIGGEIRHKYVYMRHWERFSHEIDVKAKVVIELLKEYSISVPNEAEILAEKFARQYGGEGIVDNVVNVIRLNSSAISKYLS
jgi:serine/threonine-protein kinase HipA